MPEGNVRSTLSIKLKKQLEKESGSFFPQSDIIFLSGKLGNFNEMLESMIKCGIVDQKLHWALGDGHVVITGNCLDGSEESVKILWLLYSLESKAIKKGGYLHFLPGPSDIEHCLGNWRTQHPVYAARRSNSISRYAILFDGNYELFRWLKTKNILEKIGNTAVLQSNISKGIDDYLPKFRGRKFPEGVREILQLPLESITAAQLEHLHQSFDTPSLMVVDAGSGMVKLSEQHTSQTILDRLPLIYKNGKYHHMRTNIEKAV